MKVIIESPFANEAPELLSENIIYLNAVARRLTNETNLIPLFFHSYYTQFLDDNNPEERTRGLMSSFEFHDDIKARVITIDRGISKGMRLGMERGLAQHAFPIFLSLSDDPEIQTLIFDINSIKDPRAKWKAGIQFVEDLTKNGPVNEHGDYTNYREARSDLIKEVSTIIHRFFGPLVKHIESNQ